MALAEHIENTRSRALQDALASATAGHWLRRAAFFEAARPRPGDFTGRATPEDLADRDRWLAARALACRRHAGLVPLADDAELVDAVLAEVA